MAGVDWIVRAGRDEKTAALMTLVGCPGYFARSRGRLFRFSRSGGKYIRMGRRQICWGGTLNRRVRALLWWLLPVNRAIRPPFWG